MSDAYRGKISLGRLGEHLSGTGGRRLSPHEVLAWLKEQGFQDAGGGWWTAREEAWALLRLDEFELVADSMMQSAGSVPTPPDSGWYLYGGVTPPSALAKYLLPTVLVGRHRDVRPAWRRAVKTATRTGKWDHVLTGTPFVSLAEIHPGAVVLLGPSILVQGDNYLAYLVCEEVIHACRDDDRQRWYAKSRDLILSGMDHLWFCLGMMAHGAGFLPSESYEREERAVSRLALEKLMRWWPAICECSGRFSWNGIPMDRRIWAAVPVGLCLRGGMARPEAEALIASADPAAIGQRVREWLTTT